jgi:catechol 2,3-dioxygenase-like lactoylglutathione lyase family enzyme
MPQDTVHFIFYVRDQEKSRRFYETVLGRKPRLHVPGMTEFELNSGAVLGLMPEAGLRRLLGEGIADPATAWGVPRAEVYLLTSDPQTLCSRAEQAGAKLLSPFQSRGWGHDAGYVADLDGHVLAFACASRSS